MTINKLEWDDENIEHIAWHRINPVEVEDICFGLHINYRAHKDRYILYGKTEAGRYLKVVLRRLYGAVFRPITAFDMTEKEKRRYRQRVK